MLLDVGIRNKGEVYFEFGEKAIHIQSIGKNGNVLKKLFDMQKGFFKIPLEESYVRLQIFFPTALVVSNVFYKKSGLQKDKKSHVNRYLTNQADFLSTARPRANATINMVRYPIPI